MPESRTMYAVLCSAKDAHECDALFSIWDAYDDAKAEAARLERSADVVVHAHTRDFYVLEFDANTLRNRPVEKPRSF
jgi:hypothetical protein